MMKRLLSFLLIMSFSFLVSSQNWECNSIKYAFYKERLQTKFMRYGPSFIDYSNKLAQIPYFLKDSTQTNGFIEGLDIKKVPAFGYNIPAIIWGYNSQPDNLRWGDAPKYLAFYIATLATEYKLLKMYNNDFSKTRNDLLWAIEALDRLDNWGEYLNFGPCNTSKADNPYLTNTKNGYFIRDDVGEWAEDYFYKNNLDHLGEVPKEIIDSSELKKDFMDIDYFGSGLMTFKGGIEFYWLKRDANDEACRNKEMSKDLCWHIYMGLALVRACVDDEEILKLTTDIAIRIYDNFNPDNFNNPLWFIKNPVTGENVKRGSYIGREAIGFGMAAEYITDGKVELRAENILKYYANNPNSYLKDFNLLKFNTANQARLILFNASYIDLISAFVYLCPTKAITMNLPNTEKITEQMNELPTISLATLGGIWDYKTIKKYTYERNKYEYLPLIYCLMNDKPIDIEASYFKNLLNRAPCDGPYCRWLNQDVGKTEPENKYWPDDDWRFINRLTGDKNTYYQGYLFNGLDYLLLHNLYYILYKEWLPPYYDKVNSTITHNFPYSTGSSTHGSKSNHIHLSATETITASNIIESNASVTYHAGKKIIYKPGFEIKKGANFKSYIEEIECNDCIDYSSKRRLPFVQDACNEEVNPIDNTDFSVDTLQMEMFTEEKVDGEFGLIYPIPARNSINLEFSISEESELRIDIINQMGVHIATLISDSYAQGNYVEKIDLSYLPNGTYFCRIQNSLQSRMLKFVILR